MLCIYICTRCNNNNQANYYLVCCLYSQNMYNSMFLYEMNVSTFYVRSVSALKITHVRFPIIV